MELPLAELKARLELNPEESKEWKSYAFQEWGRLLSEEQRLLKSIMKSDCKCQEKNVLFFQFKKCTKIPV